MAERAICPTCRGTERLCEEHRGQPWPHDACPGPGEPCPTCQPHGRPRRPRDWHSYVSTAEDAPPPFYAPHQPPTPPRTPQPGRRLWTLTKDGHRLDCELREHRAGPDFYRFETQTLRDGELLTGRTFETPALAEQWAAEEHRAATADGWREQER